jgi:hypothetical protein
MQLFRLSVNRMLVTVQLSSPIHDFKLWSWLHCEPLYCGRKMRLMWLKPRLRWCWNCVCLQIDWFVCVSQLVAILPLAVAHTLGNLLTNISLGKVAVSFTHTIKAMEPFFTVVLSSLLLGQVMLNWSLQFKKKIWLNMFLVRIKLLFFVFSPYIHWKTCT